MNDSWRWHGNNDERLYRMQRNQQLMCGIEAMQQKRNDAEIYLVRHFSTSCTCINKRAQFMNG